MTKKKVLIVGAGLSGVSVSIQLIRKGADVTLIDNGVNFSSIIAAGMINPLVFRRMTKSWRVDDFIPYLKSFYAELETETNSTFFHEIPVRRLFSSEQERDFWLKKQEREDFFDFMYKVTPEDMAFDQAKNPFGSGRVKETYYVDVYSFFAGLKPWVKSHGTILEEEFEAKHLNGTIYRDVTYDDVVFCEGYLLKHNPWFGDLPLDQTKGQTLVVQAPKLPEDVSLNRKCFMLPKGNHQFKIGSTYEWNDPTTHVTEEGKNEILNNLSHITDEEITVVDQEAGIRPTTRDRRPLLGTHPTIKNYHLFNGLGAKGYMLAPLIAKEFVEYLVDGAELDKEVDIKRYYDRDLDSSKFN
ncbi:MAG: FAD-dependent oxidoreductase [Crocinitomicaceae bacterium]|nr:FAD-dependent oxidoreductase [Crocinitomicaceae bacterium]